MPFKLSLFLSIIAAVFKERADLVAENTALRHQLSCFIHRGPRPRLRRVDRVFWVLLSRFWDGWRECLTIVKPATVLVWHRKGFKLFWRWKSRRRGLGRPRIPVEVRRLIIEMAEMNVGWALLEFMGNCSSWVSRYRRSPFRVTCPSALRPQVRGSDGRHSCAIIYTRRLRLTSLSCPRRRSAFSTCSSS